MRIPSPARMVLLLAAALPAVAAPAPGRPRIVGISHIALYTADPAASEHFYTEVVGAVRQPDPEDPRGVRYALSPTQFIEVLPQPPNSSAGPLVNHLDHTAWNTTDAEALRKYLAAKGWKTPPRVEHGSDGSRWFLVLDPEGNRVQFVQPPSSPRPIDAPHAAGHRIIHFGFLVHSRAAEDTFYRDLLGFRPYWAGGPNPGQVAYVSQQAPDGRDWLEYMLVGPSGTVTQRRLNSMDHLSIGETSVPQAAQQLTAQHRLDCRHDAAPHVGQDGKYQFNLYDPDGTRIELMDFRHTAPPNPPTTAPDPTE